MKITPDCNTILKLAEEYSVVPVCKEIYADITTPITLLRKISAISKRYYLLESIEGGETWGRYSFLGYDPIMRVTCRSNEVVVEKKGKQEIYQTEKPLEIIREIMKDYRSPKLEGMPPFTGGFVGYFAYSMIGYAEPVLKIKKGTFPDYDVMLFDKVIAYDHLKQKICIIVNMKTDRVMENYGEATAEIAKIAAMI